MNLQIKFSIIFLATSSYIIIIAGISSIFVSRHLAKRITLLRNAANKIAVGDFTIKVDTSGNDEIHDLVKDIDMRARMLSENTQIVSQ